MGGVAHGGEGCGEGRDERGGGHRGLEVGVARRVVHGGRSAGGRGAGRVQVRGRGGHGALDRRGEGGARPMLHTGCGEWDDGRRGGRHGGDRRRLAVREGLHCDGCGERGRTAGLVAVSGRGGLAGRERHEVRKAVRSGSRCCGARAGSAQGLQRRGAERSQRARDGEGLGEAQRREHRQRPGRQEHQGGGRLEGGRAGWERLPDGRRRGGRGGWAVGGRPHGGEVRGRYDGLAAGVRGDAGSRDDASAAWR